MKNKIRFLATGDFHSDKDFVKIVKKYGDLKNMDFIIFTGDLSDRNDDFNDMLSIFKGKQIFMTPGNHESKKGLDILKEKYNVHLIGNQPVKVSDDLVLFGSNYVPIGPYGLHEEGILENLVENFKSVEDIKFKILVSHMPPFDTQIGNASPFEFVEGSVGVKLFLENFSPNVALCGHIHESSGLEEIVNNTNVVNVGRTFKIFEFDKKKKSLEIVN